MKYNTTRKQLTLPEYGRNIQDMVSYTLTIKNDEERNAAARSIVKLMEQMHPHVKQIEDFKHKLWDHLHIMADYNLDVDSPYPKPDREVVERRPDKITYPANGIRFRHYGRVVEKLIDKACEYEAGEEKDALVKTIANLMKRFYLIWNRDSVNDDDIWQHIHLLSKGKLEKPEDFDLPDTGKILKANKPKKKTNHGKRKPKFKRNYR